MSKKIKHYYCLSNGGFYHDDIHGKDIPSDVVELSTEEWQELLAGQGQGKQIIVGVNKRPILVDRVVDVSEMRRRRDEQLSTSDWLVIRHRDELDLLNPTTLTENQYRSLQSWRQQLRNLTLHPDFPNIRLPERPKWN